MNLELLKRFIDDGVAKHQAFTELKTVVDEAASVDQYVKELRVQADSINGSLDAKKAELASLSISLDAMKDQFRKQSAEFDATVQKRKADADKEYQQIVQAHQQRVTAMRSQITAIEGQVAKAQEEKNRAEASVNDAQAAATAAIKAEVNLWENKLAASKLAYDQFIANLPK